MEAHVRATPHAALFLRAQGASGYEFLPLLTSAMSIGRSLSENTEQVRKKCWWVTVLYRLGLLLALMWFDACDAFHAKVLEWLIDLRFPPHVEIAETDSMALVTCVHYLVRQFERLTNLVSFERREDDTGIITRRGIAFSVTRQCGPRVRKAVCGIAGRVPSTYKRWTPGSQITGRDFQTISLGTTAERGVSMVAQLNAAISWF